MLPSILCFANSRDQAAQVVDRLQAANVPVSDISVLMQPNGSERPEPIKALGSSSQPPVGLDTKTEAGTATGGITGAAAGIGTMSAVGLTPLLILAPVVVGVGALAGAALGAAATAAHSGLADYGIAPSRMRHYQEKMLRGGYLVAVRTEDEAELERARTAYEQAGIQEIELFRLTKKLT